MLKNSFFVFGLLLVLSISSCRIFKKDCNCPHFGQMKTPPTEGKSANV